MSKRQSKAQSIKMLISPELPWTKSSYSPGDLPKCVAVAIDHERKVVNVADTKKPTAAPLKFHFDEWDAFIRGVKADQFDLADSVA